MFSRILCATSLDKASNEAVKQAVQLASQYNSKIIMLNIREAFMSKEEMSMLRVSVEGVKKIFEKIANEAKDEMKKTISKLSTENVKVEYILKDGKPTTAICKEAQKNKVDLIILGISEKNVLSNFLFRSTASYVIEHVKIPVMVVPIIEQ